MNGLVEKRNRHKLALSAVVLIGISREEKEVKRGSESIYVL